MGKIHAAEVAARPRAYRGSVPIDVRRLWRTDSGVPPLVRREGREARSIQTSESSPFSQPVLEPLRGFRCPTLGPAASLPCCPHPRAGRAVPCTHVRCRGPRRRRPHCHRASLRARPVRHSPTCHTPVTRPSRTSSRARARRESPLSLNRAEPAPCPQSVRWRVVRSGVRTACRSAHTLDRDCHGDRLRGVRDSPVVTL